MESGEVFGEDGEKYRQEQDRKRQRGTTEAETRSEREILKGTSWGIRFRVASGLYLYLAASLRPSTT